jgi:hypothetical protein
MSRPADFWCQSTPIRTDFIITRLILPAYGARTTRISCLKTESTREATPVSEKDLEGIQSTNVRAVVLTLANTIFYQMNKRSYWRHRTQTVALKSGKHREQIVFKAGIHAA